MHPYHWTSRYSYSVHVVIGALYTLEPCIKKPLAHRERKLKFGIDAYLSNRDVVMMSRLGGWLKSKLELV